MTVVTDFNLYHRTDCCQDRLIAANIIISPTADYTANGITCSASTAGGNTAQPETGTCGGAQGQFVTVQHSGDYITICEFEVMGYAADNYPIPNAENRYSPPRFLPFTSVFMSEACPLDTVDDQLYAVSEACCTELTPCPADYEVGIPGECTFDCNRIFSPFMTNCYSTIAALVSVHSDGPNTTLALLDEYAQTCQHFSVASMATAVYEAHCSSCGDGIVDSGEYCDEGEMNSADGTCGTDCVPAHCTVVPTQSGRTLVPKGTGILESVTHDWDDVNRAGRKFTLFALPWQGTFPDQSESWNSDSWSHGSSHDYQRVCHAHGMRPVTTDESSYTDQMTQGSCAPDQYHCMGAYGVDGRCSSSDCDDIINDYNNAWGDSHGYNPDSPTSSSTSGSGFVINSYQDANSYIWTYPWDDGGWGSNHKLVVCGKEYDYIECGGGTNLGCLSPDCTGPGCINPRELVPPGTEAWDSTSGGERTSHGRDFTLFKLPLLSDGGPGGYPVSGDSDQSNNWWMELECQKWGLRPVGKHDVNWNNALGMPSSWSSNIPSDLSSHTSWDNFLTLEDGRSSGMCADFSECSPDQRDAHVICGYEY